MREHETVNWPRLEMQECDVFGRSITFANEIRCDSIARAVVFRATESHSVEAVETVPAAFSYSRKVAFCAAKLFLKRCIWTVSINLIIYYLCYANKQSIIEKIYIADRARE